MTGDQQDLTAALEAHQPAMREAPPVGPQRAQALVTLSNTLQEHPSHAGDEGPDPQARLAEAVELTREALQLVPRQALATAKR